MTDTPKESGFDPRKWYPLDYLAYKWGYSDKPSLEKGLRKSGAVVVDLGRKVKLVRLDEGMRDGP